MPAVPALLVRLPARRDRALQRRNPFGVFGDGSDGSAIAPPGVPPQPVDRTSGRPARLLIRGERESGEGASNLRPWSVSAWLLMVLLAACGERHPAAPPAFAFLERLPTRPMEGRLARAMPFRPYVAPPSAAPVTAIETRFSAIPEIETALGNQLPSADHGDRLAENAELDLAHGKVETAIANLTLATSHGVASARIDIDAAAAYLERGTRQGDAFDLLAALRYSLHGVNLAPTSPAAQFNLGLVLEALFLEHQARRAWQHYLDLDPGSDWAGEVRRRLHRLELHPFQQHWEASRAALRRHEPLSAATVTELVRWYPHQLRELTVEELLPAVAVELAAQKPGSGKATVLVAQLAREMHTQRGDWLLSESLRALEDAARPDPALSTAHRQLALGMRRYHAQDFRTAATLLGRSIPVLRAASSPLAWEAELYRAICLYYERAALARPRLAALLAAIDQRRFPSLAGRTLWMLGTIAMVEERHEEALAAFREMRDLLLRGAGEDQAAMADSDLGDDYELRGEVYRGWVHRLRALRILIPRGDARRRHSLLFEAAQALARRHQLDLALAFLDEVIANAADWGEPLARAEGFAMRARVRAERGESAAALADAELSLAAVAAMPPGGLRRRVLGVALVSRGLAWLATDPARATRDLDAGQASELATGWRGDRTLVLTSLAKADLARGDVASARKFLIAAVQSYERTRREAAETQARIAIFEHAQTAFDTLISLALETGDPARARAFAWAERSRSRYLADSSRLRPPVTGLGLTIDARTLVRLLPPHTTLVEFSVLPERTIAWVAETGNMRSVVLPLGKAALSRRVAEFRDAVEAGDGNPRALGAQLFDELLRPLGLTAGAERRLVIVPDGALELAPLGALYDRERRQYLVEQATVSLAPSATLAAALLARSHRRGVAGRDTALVVGAPVLENTGHADLEALPGAAAEAAAIAKIYGRSVLLVGRDATRERFVSELSRCRVAHFAGHALTMVGGTDSSMLLFTPASPSEGGELSAARVRSLSLPDLDLVVLAACRSAAGYSPGREGPMSLASAFVAAGVPTVIAAAGPVDDRAAPRLMHRLHSLVASGTDPPAALREVMLECLHSRDPALQAPSAWAMFTAFGI